MPPVTSSLSSTTTMNQPVPDDLSTAVFGVVQGLSPIRKASFLLEHAMALIEAGR
jgi:hypothetical protein